MLKASPRGFPSKNREAKSGIFKTGIFRSCLVSRISWSPFYRLCWGQRHAHPY